MARRMNDRQNFFLLLTPKLGKAQQPQEQRYVQYFFLCPNTGLAAGVWDL